jgi:hypothetical protein
LPPHQSLSFQKEWNPRIALKGEGLWIKSMQNKDPNRGVCMIGEKGQSKLCNLEDERRTKEGMWGQSWGDCRDELMGRMRDGACILERK